MTDGRHIQGSLATACTGMQQAFLHMRRRQHQLKKSVLLQAGLPRAVTIATNMAGRGTDICLGGDAQGLLSTLLKFLWLEDLAAPANTGAPSLLACKPRQVFASVLATRSATYSARCC